MGVATFGVVGLRQMGHFQIGVNALEVFSLVLSRSIYQDYACLDVWVVVKDSFHTFCNDECHMYEKIYAI